ncbi:MAG: sulfite exporter TauE/SafE family protein [Chloroflexi bacterium]|nr:sulfite exporter TauE/SafE family protein [Chloroflexota bacterium]
MDWGVYWFMFPACVVIASVAMLSGISGAAMLSPMLILVFPLLGVPLLAAPAAIGMALFTEFFGFTSGVMGYVRRCLVDYQVAQQMIIIAVPFAAAGALGSHLLDPALLKTLYGAMMLGLAGVLVRQSLHSAHSYPAALAAGPAGRQREFIATQTERVIRATGGVEYRYAPCPPRVGQAFTAGGALLAGAISTGIGEIELPQLVGRCRMPLPVAAGTSILIVAATVAVGSLTHLASLIGAGGLEAVPWNLVIYTVPGALIGGQVGARLQGRVPEALMERLMAGLFVLIGLAFLASVWGG